MSKAKALEALQKSEDYKNIMMALAAESEETSQPTLQPADGHVNPLGRMGVVPSTNYSQYNMV